MVGVVANLAPNTEVSAPCDVAVVGGGLVGSALAWGLARAGQTCQVFDEGDTALRTARGNFGLVWVQGKGASMGRYALWTLAAAQLWPAFAAELEAATGLDLAYSRGGLRYALDEADLAGAVAQLETIQGLMGEAAYDFEVWQGARLHQALPMVGAIAGATYTEMDGHCNPLVLLRALQQDMQRLGAAYRPMTPVAGIRPLPGGGYAVLDAAGRVLVEAGKLVLAAGHGSGKLAEALGLTLPIHPDQGQILVTEKVAPILPWCSDTIRQTDNGSILLGASSKPGAQHTRTDLATLAEIADEALRVFPFLGRLRLQRAWGALRVMTPDGYPVYQQSEACPGVFSFACHSGVTLASVHAMEAARWVMAGRLPEEMAAFHPRRFEALQAQEAACSSA